MRDADPFIVRSLAAYAARIGADQINFRKYMITRYEGSYPKEKVLIKLDKDGTVYVSDAMYAPTEDEAKAIKEEVSKQTFPESILAGDVKDLLPLMKSSIYHEFKDVDGDGLIKMVQERREQEDGGKYFVAWTKFNDNVWRSMEPDGPLPFWRPTLKPEERRARVMIHEGCKAAEAVNRIVREREPHPWLDELLLFEHWGAIGGALAPQRLDYAPLHKKKPAEVVYFCDADPIGREALAKVSEAYGEPMKGVVINDDKRWPKGWDIADDLPKSLYRDGVWNGPSIRELMRPATWAIGWKPPKTPKGKSEAMLTNNFVEEIIRVIRPQVYYHRDFPSRQYTAKEFNDYFRTFAGNQRFALDQMMSVHGSNVADTIAYKPDRGPGLMHHDGCTVYNAHVPTKIEAHNGSARPFLDYIHYLVPGEREQKSLLRWIATLIARPDIRMKYGLLLVSEEQGIGKSTLCDHILAPLVGLSNYMTVSENNIENRFNDWAQNRLIVCHEAYAGHSFKMYNKLKSIVTDRFLGIEKKGLQIYQIELCSHVILCSNHVGVLKLDSEDRRWFAPQLTREGATREYWHDLYHWLREENGLGSIKQWAENHLKILGPVGEGDHAPSSEFKDEIVEAGLSEESLKVRKLLYALEEHVLADPTFLAINTRPSGANGEWKPRGIVLSDSQGAGAINKELERSKARPIKKIDFRRIAKREGYHVSDKQIYCSDWVGEGCDKHARLLVQDPTLLELSHDELKKTVKPINLYRIAPELMSM
jgi:Family of unknown function (DUF5906)